MSEHPNRDTQREEIARIIANECPARWSEHLDAADALIAAGLLVPAGLTAEKRYKLAAQLRVLAEWLDTLDERFGYQGTEVQDELRAWADALGEG